MIKIEGLRKNFGRVQALNGIDLVCNKGQCIALLGPNACGKTTLIKCLLGLAMPTYGKILFNGDNIVGKNDYKNKIGYMPQIGRYPENMTIGQVIETIRSLRKTSVTDEYLLNEFNIGAIAQKKMRTLSGGTLQKVSATLAFLFSPDVLILDEPTAGLDPIASEILKAKIIQQLNDGKLVLITSHILSELDDLATQVVFMQEGKIILHYPVEQLRKEANEKQISKAVAHMLKRVSYE